MLWLPLIGPIIEGLTGMFSKWQDTKLGTLKTIRGSEVQEAQVSAQIIQSTQDSIGLRILRDILLLPPIAWASLIGWDTIVAKRFPDAMFHVAPYPDTLAYLPYMAFVFLLGNIGLNMWNRR